MDIKKLLLSKSEVIWFIRKDHWDQLQDTSTLLFLHHTFPLNFGLGLTL